MASTRLVYLWKEPKQSDLVADRIAEPGPLKENWVLGEFVSGTICATDVTNMAGELGHGVTSEKPKILGHECCFRVLESRNVKVAKGKYIVPLGSDFHGFAEREAFRPILSCTPEKDYETALTPRGYYDPDDERVKAVCVTEEWWPGISLIEPTTHVLTSLLHTGALNARGVVVLGAGFCGQVAGLLCKLFGVQRVTLVDINPERLKGAIDRKCADPVTELGKTPLPGLDPTEPDGIKALIKKTQGTYADFVFDALPGLDDKDESKRVSRLATTRDLGAQLLRPGGTYVLYSAAEFMTLPTLSLLAKGLDVRGAGYDSRLISFSKRAAQMETVLRLASSGLLRLGKFVEKTIYFEDEPAVVEAFRDHKNFLKVELQAKSCLARNSPP